MQNILTRNWFLFLNQLDFGIYSFYGVYVYAEYFNYYRPYGSQQQYYVSELVWPWLFKIE